jgi:uncharacterized protein YhaN
VRIRHLEVAGFGGLRNQTSGPGELGDFVVVLGDNEAGKTTLFEFLCSMLYGIYPTSSERHPYAPWDGAELAGALRIQIDQDLVDVRRRLRSSPSGTIVRDGRSESLRNDDLPFVSHISPRVFRQVYALGLADLASLAEEGWEAVQDRILGRLGASDLRPAREVADELEAEARALWRPDRRGTPRVRRLDDAIRDAAARRPEVRQKSTERRAAAERLTDTRRVLESARAAREANQTLLARLRLWVPIRTELARLTELRRVAGDPGRLAGLSADPVGELDRIDERIRDAERHVERCRRERDAAAEEANSLGDLDRRVLQHEASIERLRAGASAVAVLTPRLGAAVQELRALERRLTDESDALPWSATPRLDALLEASIPALAAAYRRWSEAADPAAAPPAAKSDSSTVSMAPAGVLGVLGLLVAATAVPAWADALGLGGIPTGYPLAFGAVLVALGVWLWAGVRSVRQARDRHVEGARAVEEERRSEERRARSEVERLLAPLGLEAGARPDSGLLPRLDRCRQLTRDRDDLHREVDELRSQLGALDSEAERLRDLLLVSATGDAVATSTVLQDRLGRAREKATSAERGASRLPALDAVHREATEALGQARHRRAAFEQSLLRFEGDDPRAGAEAAARAVEAHREAERRWSSLVREHADLDGIIEAIGTAEQRGEAWIEQADPLGSLARDVEARSEEIERWVALEKELEAQTLLREGDETLDDLEGEISRLRQERDAVRRAHDRLWILSTLVDRADREIRELHQPAILKLAGRHLSVLTAGRYDRLDVGSDRSRTLQVSGPAVPGSIEVGSPLSTGTQEQIYVALRLALMDHLDDGQVHLPMFLDEVLVNWDAMRRDRGLDLLDDMTAERQVFLFTCHPHLAHEAVARGATLWRLAPP